MSAELKSKREKATEAFKEGDKLRALGIIKTFSPGWFTKEELGTICRAYEMQKGAASFYEQLGFNKQEQFDKACSIIENKLEGFY